MASISEETGVQDVGAAVLVEHEDHLPAIPLIRETPRDAFLALGPARYVTHTGARPLGVTWKLETLIPAALFEKFAALLAA